MFQNSTCSLQPLTQTKGSWFIRSWPDITLQS